MSITSPPARRVAVALLVALLVVLIAAWPARAAPPTDHTVPVAAAVDDVAASSGLPGFAAVVTRGDGVLWVGGRGQDHAGAPMAAQTPLRLASLSKSMTAVAVVRLVERGLIALDRPVAEQLPGFSTADPRGTAITVRHLLTHTSGLPDAGIGIDPIYLARDLADAVNTLRLAQLDTAPGAHFRYANANYEVAARLLEVAGRAPYAEVMRREVFAPLGMHSTGVGGRDEAIDGAVSVLGAWVPRTWPASMLSAGGAAGVISTADDLGRWLRFAAGDGAPLLSRGSQAAMRTPAGPGSRYGLGWEADDAITGHRVFGHTGTLGVRTAAHLVDPSTGVGVAVATESASLSDDAYIAAARLLVAANGNGGPAPSSGRATTELVCASVTVLALVAGALGVLRARRWARQRRRVGGVVLRLLPAGLATLAALALPWLVAPLLGGGVSWAVLTTFPASFTVTVLALGLAGAVTAAARGAALRRVRPLGSDA